MARLLVPSFRLLFRRLLGLAAGWQCAARATRNARPPRLRTLLWLGACTALAGCPRDIASDAAQADAARDPVTGMAQGETAGFAVADRVRAFAFPRDHGPHPAYRTEWWYFTGHLRAADGRRFGFQYTVFRQALAPPGTMQVGPSGAKSAWRTDTAWLAHLAVTDLAGADHAGAARIARGALGLAGARTDARGVLAIDVDGWQLERAADGVFAIRAAAETGAGPVDAPAASAEGRASGPGLRLRLRPVSDVVLQGDRGLSRKGPRSASYYFSIPRFEVEGDVRAEGGAWTAVRGGAWLDREWSTGALAPEQVGWDWFSLNLEDGSDLMLFRLRRRDGSRDPFDAGTLVRNGVHTTLRTADFDARPLAWWTDERQRRWPTRWQLDIPRAGLRLQVDALLQDQLMRVGLEYWEGAVDVRGTALGHGYLEMTGYTADGAGGAARE